MKATEIQKQYNCNIILSNLLEVEATNIDRENGLDIADYIIMELNSKKTTFEIQKSFSPQLETLIRKNDALLFLIIGLRLEEMIIESL